MTVRKQNELIRLAGRFSHLWRHEASSTVIRRGADKLAVNLVHQVKRWQFRGRTFELFGHRLPYHIDNYNATWRNERCIEIAAALHVLGQWPNGRILELGNVLSYYVDHTHQVIDKYERAPGVLNVDFEGFEPGERFDGFVSVSTLEHIGWDDTPQEPEKVLRCMDRIRECVRYPERVFVTFPLGYNPYLDDLVRQRALPFQESTAMIRVDAAQNWLTVDVPHALRPEYGYGRNFACANACFFGRGLTPRRSS